jgi:hypothetical protein
MKKTQLLALLLIFSIQFLYSQGTGDSNVTLFGNIAPSFKNKDEFSKVSFFSRLDKGKNNVYSIAPTINYETNINEQLDFQLWITSKYVTGDLVSGFSIGDFTLFGTYHLDEDFLTKDIDQSIDFGLTLSLSGGKKLKENLSNNFYATYPMEYQSSLGTIDLILGYSIKSKILNCSIGFQQPITSKNQNNFFPSYFDLGDINENYPASNEMKRSGNIYSRIGYFVINEKKKILNLGLTAFYKLNNDKYFVNNPNSSYPSKGYNEAYNTNGLSLNAILQFNYKINKNAEISLYTGIGLIKKKETIDGL